MQTRREWLAQAGVGLAIAAAPRPVPVRGHVCYPPSMTARMFARHVRETWEQVPTQYLYRGPDNQWISELALCRLEAEASR